MLSSISVHFFQSQMIKFYGYPAEEHHVVTEDGYILSLQRIPKGIKGVPSNGQVVFMQHGLVSSSADYVMNLPEQSLGFILADLGYDVWLGNSRGNTYSNKHVNMTTDDPKFWAFRFVRSETSLLVTLISLSLWHELISN